VFTKEDEPLEVDDWLRTMEHKFSLIRCSETQKPLFAAQQLRGAAGSWWENFLAIQTPGHQVFRAHYILKGLMAMKAGEFLTLQLLDILNIITKSRLSFLILITVPKMPNLSLMPLKPSCHAQHDIRDAVLKYAIALLNK